MQHPSNVSCPACGAYAGEPCQSLSMLPGALAPLKGYHAEREARAKERTFPEHVRSFTFPRHVRADGSGVYEEGKSPAELRAKLAGVGPCPACAEGLVAIGKPCRACGYSL